MNFLEQVGLLTLIVLALYLLSEFLAAQKEYQRKSDEEHRVNTEAAARYRALEEEKGERKKRDEEIARATTDKQNAFLEKWKSIDPEEEYLIRVGRKRSPLFDPDLYKGHPGISPWGSSVEQEKQLRNPDKTKPLIKVDDIVHNYGIPVETLELLYRGYRNEYYNDERRFSDVELEMQHSIVNWFASTPAEKAKLNLHQITLNKIVQTLDELREIGIAKDTTPIYRL